MEIFHIGFVLRHYGYLGGYILVTILGVLSGILGYYWAKKTETAELVSPYFFGFCLILASFSCYVVLFSLALDSISNVILRHVFVVVFSMLFTALFMKPSSTIYLLRPHAAFDKFVVSLGFSLMIVGISVVSNLREIQTVQLTMQERAEVLIAEEMKAEAPILENLKYNLARIERYQVSPQPFYTGLAYWRVGKTEKAIEEFVRFAASSSSADQFFWAGVIAYLRQDRNQTASQFHLAQSADLEAISLMVSATLDTHKLETLKSAPGFERLPASTVYSIEQIVSTVPLLKVEMAHARITWIKPLLDRYLLSAVIAKAPVFTAPKMYEQNPWFFVSAILLFLLTIYGTSSLIRDREQIVDWLFEIKGEEIVILFNATESMQPSWDLLEKNVKWILFQMHLPNPQAKLCVCAFSEDVHGEIYLHKSKMTRSARKIKRFMKRVKCAGNSDRSQPIELALKHELLSQNRRPVVVLIGECPPHGIVDFFVPDEDYKTIAKKLAHKQVLVFTIVVGSWEHTVQSFQEIAELTHARAIQVADLQNITTIFADIYLGVWMPNKSQTNPTFSSP